jgi:hypothetical protein
LPNQSAFFSFICCGSPAQPNTQRSPTIQDLFLKISSISDGLQSGDYNKEYRDIMTYVTRLPATYILQPVLKTQKSGQQALGERRDKHVQKPFFDLADANITRFSYKIIVSFENDNS